MVNNLKKLIPFRNFINFVRYNKHYPTSFRIILSYEDEYGDVYDCYPFEEDFFVLKESAEKFLEETGYNPIEDTRYNIYISKVLYCGPQVECFCKIYRKYLFKNLKKPKTAWKYFYYGAVRYIQRFI